MSVARCFRSNRNYPKQVAAALGVATFRDATCGSATTDNFADPQPGLPLGGTNPPQFDRLTRTTDLITIGIGGNDVGLAAFLVQCINLLPSGTGLPSPLGGSCRQKMTANGVDQMSKQIRAAEPKLVAAFEGAHERSPKARVLAVNYMAGVSRTGCWPLVQDTDEDSGYIYAKLVELNAMLKRAAKEGDAELVDTFSPTIGHDWCQLPARRYVEGVIPVSLNAPAVAVPFHPNSAGASAQARIVLSAVTRSGT